MDSCTFIVDVIVTHIDAPSLNLKNTKGLSVLAIFNRVNMPITESRINVNEFKTSAATEIKENPQKLRHNLENCGMEIMVKYKSQLVGTGRISFPQSVVDKMQDNMEDLIHSETCNFVKKDQVVGTLDLLIRVIIKCDDKSKSTKKDCGYMDTSIKPQDILFVMSASQQCPISCDPCLDTCEPEEGDMQLHLDLNRYKTYNTEELPIVENDLHNPTGKAICSELKGMMVECMGILDKVTTLPGQSKPIKPPCRGIIELDCPCGSQSEKTAPILQSDSLLPSQPADQEDINVICNPNLISVHNTEASTLKPSQMCPICKSDISWLPKLACCVTCGAKPMPIATQPEQNEPTVDQILLEYLAKPKEGIEDYCKDPCTKNNVTKEPRNECQCTCKGGKLCAHCRVRRDCAELLQLLEKSEIVREESRTSMENCIIEKSEDPSPFLARVFSELRDMYDIKDTIKSSRHMRQPKGIDSPKKTSNKAIAKMALKPKISQAPLHTPIDLKRNRIGAHRYCANPHKPVSRRHGWNWSTSREARKYGWRPGAILKPLKRIMNFFLPEKSAFSVCKDRMKAEKDASRLDPVLKVCKKDGNIIISLRAVNNTNVEMKPIVFKIVKSDMALAIRAIKRKLKAEGFIKCTCHQTVMMCVCRDTLGKKKLEAAVEIESKRHCIENCVDQLVLTDTSESEMEYDLNVTPPAGIPKPQICQKLCTVNHCTQTNLMDLKVPDKYPIKYSPYWRYYNCAAGDRYTNTAFGMPGEIIFEDGIFGYRGGGPHGESAAAGGRGKSHTIWGKHPGAPIRGGGRTGAGGEGRPAVFSKKTFPGAKKVPGGKGSSQPIPVKMTQKYYKAVEKAEREKQQGAQMQIEKKKKGIHLIKYLEEKGAVPIPWNPNKPKPKGEVFNYSTIVGSDGLTDAQRKRLALRQIPVPPLDSMPRLGKGYNPCIVYNSNPCGQCCNTYGYDCYC